MHTSKDYITKEGPKLWIHHNSDFSGECYVNWEIKAGEGHGLFTFEWKVSGEELLTGNFKGTQLFTKNNESKPEGEVPHWVMGRAVATALRVHLTRQMVSFVEQL
jgi:hypothetical protein